MASQRVMLERTGQQGANISDEKLTQLFEKDLEKISQWVNQQGNFSMHLLPSVILLQPVWRCGVSPPSKWQCP